MSTLTAVRHDADLHTGTRIQKRDPAEVAAGQRGLFLEYVEPERALMVVWLVGGERVKVPVADWRSGIWQVSR